MVPPLTAGSATFNRSHRNSPGIFVLSFFGIDQWKGWAEIFPPGIFIAQHESG